MMKIVTAGAVGVRIAAVGFVLLVLEVYPVWWTDYKILILKIKKTQALTYKWALSLVEQITGQGDKLNNTITLKLPILPKTEHLVFELSSYAFDS